MAGPVQLTNYIVNPGAEVDTSPWGSFAFTTSTGVTLTRDTGAGNFYGGSAGFKVVSTGAAAYAGIEIPLAYDGTGAASGSEMFQAGTAYTFEVYLKSSSGATGLTLLLGAYAGDTTTAAITITGSWAKYSVTWTPAADTSKAGAAIFNAAATATTFFADNAIVTASSSGVGYFDGDTEGCQWVGTRHASMSRSPAGFQNLVPNPAFQADAARWGTTYLFVGTATFARVADSDAESGYALRVFCAGSVADEGVFTGLTGAGTDGLTMRAGVKYYVRVRLKRSYGANLKVALGTYASPFDDAILQSSAAPSGTGYTEYSGVVTKGQDGLGCLYIRCGSTTATLFHVADVSVIPLGPGTGITQTAGETLLIDPWSEDAANVQLALTAGTPAAGGFVLLEHDYPPPDLDPLQASSVDTEGEITVQSRYKNRQVTLKLRCYGTSAANLATNLGYLQQKMGKLNREGGTLKRTAPSTDTIVFDIVGAQARVDQNKRFGTINAATVDVTLECRPFGRGPAVTLSDKVETTLPYVSQVESGIKGDVPALGRLVIDEDQGQNQWTALWGIQSRYYDSAASAALFFQAESLTLQGAGAATSTAAAGYSGSGSVLANNLATSYQSILSSQATGGGAHWSHIGDFRVYGRVYVPTGNTGQVTVRAQWTVGDGRTWTKNDEIALDANVKGVWRMVDLGMVSIQKVAAGTQRWELQLLAKSTVAGDDVHLDWYLLMPTSEGSGVASGVQAAIDYSSFQARDEFNQTAGALAGKTPNTGGNWAGAGDADDFNVSGSGTVTRTAVSDTATNMSNARLETMATPASLAGLLAYVVQKTDAYNSTLGHGLLLRYTDTSNFLAVYATYSAMSGTNLTVNIRTRVAGTETTIGTAYITSILPTSNYVLAASVGADGQVIVYGAPEGIGWSVLASGYSADLATGGTLASGKVGLFDWITGGTACTRTYSAFGAYGVNADYAVPASQSLEIRHDRVIREDSGGTIWQPPSSYKGDYLLVPPAGREGRSCRWIAKLSRGPILTGADSGIDDISARLTYTPRYLVVPEP